MTREVNGRASLDPAIYKFGGPGSRCLSFLICKLNMKMTLGLLLGLDEIIKVECSAVSGTQERLLTVSHIRSLET